MVLLDVVLGTENRLQYFDEPGGLFVGLGTVLDVFGKAPENPAKVVDGIPKGFTPVAGCDLTPPS